GTLTPGSSSTPIRSETCPSPTSFPELRHQRRLPVAWVGDRHPLAGQPCVNSLNAGGLGERRGVGRAYAIQGTRRAAVGDKVDAPAIRFLTNHRPTLHNEKRVGGVRQEFVAEHRTALREAKNRRPQA